MLASDHSSGRISHDKFCNLYYIYCDEHCFTPTRRERVAEYAGLRVHDPHALRHCFGSPLMLRGADANVVVELMGHSKLATTQAHVHATQIHCHDAIGRLMRARRGNPQSSGHGDSQDGATKLKIIIRERALRERLYAPNRPSC